MEKLTRLQFDRISNGKIFATGIMPNSPEGIFMTRDGGELRWVAVKGYANDWAIYCHWSCNSEDWIKRSGDKIIYEHHIKKCVLCDDTVFKLYRY